MARAAAPISEDVRGMYVRCLRLFPSGVSSRVTLATLVVGGVLVLGPAAQAASSTHSWSMDEPSGAGTMVDSGSPTQTNGTWTDIQAGVPGFAGTAYRFKGTSRVTVADNPSLDPGSDMFTTTVHVKFTDIPSNAVGGDYDLIRKGLGSTKGGYWKVEIYPNSAHTKTLGLCQMKGSSGSVKITGSPSSLNDGQWHTISCTKTSSDVTLAVDGTNYKKTVAIGAIANADPLTLGSKDIGDDWYSGDMDEVSLNIGSSSTSQPTITGFSPNQGPVGTSVTVTGTSFTGASVVTFTDGVTASFTVNSDTQITATVPSGATTGPISVTTGGGTATSSGDFTVTVASPPTISGFSPIQGPVGTSVTITGTSFTGASVVTFTDTVSASFTVNSDTQITATVPSGATTGPISVTTGGGAATSADSFTVTPSSGGTITEVQKAFAAAGSTSVSATFGSTPTPGTVLVAVAVNCSSTSVTFGTPTGWSVGRSEPGAAVFYRVGGASEARTITVSPSDGQPYTLRLWIFELGGADAGNPFDQSGRATFSSSTSTTISTDGSTSQADEWAVAAIGWKGQVTSGSQTFDSGFTAFTGNTRGYAASKVLNVAGAVSTTASWTTSAGGVRIMGTFRAAGG